MSCCALCGQELPERNQLSLAGPPPERKARRGDPTAARNAAVAAFPRAGLQRRTLIECFAKHRDGLTSEQAAGLTGMPPTSASTRCTELLSGGWLERLPEMRRTGNGGTAHIFLITQAALDQLRSERAALVIAADAARTAAA